VNVFQPVSRSTYTFGPQDNLLGVWVSKANASHVGLAYVSPDDEKTHLLELAAHEKLKNDAVDLSSCTKKYLVAPTQLNQDRAIFICGYLNQLALRAPTISYGIDWIGAKGCFDANGDYKPLNGEVGLTCATFVCEALRGCAEVIVNINSWPLDTKLGLQWKEALVQGYRDRNSIPPETLERIESTSPVVRLHPAEMAAAAVKPPSEWPLDQPSVEPAALALVTQFCEAFPTPAKPAPAAG